MFKAALITNPAFIFFRKHATFLYLLHAFFMSIIINYMINENVDIPVFIMGILGYLTFIGLGLAIQKRITNSLQSNKLEIDENGIRILDKKNALLMEWKTETISALIIQEAYVFEHSFWKEMWMQLQGKANFHFIQIKHQDNLYNMRFILDSNYMANKLNVILNKWKSGNISFQYANKPLDKLLAA